MQEEVWSVQEKRKRGLGNEQLIKDMAVDNFELKWNGGAGCNTREKKQKLQGRKEKWGGETERNVQWREGWIG